MSENKKNNTFPVVEQLVAKFAEAVQTAAAPHGETVIVEPSKAAEIIGWLKNEPGLDFNMLMDLHGVDYLLREPRFEVVYQLYSLKHNRRIWLRAQLGESNPAIDSIVSHYPGANWLEREAWDMFGITFTGHPDLRRILMYEEFEGHPLRRDYPFDKRQPICPPLTKHL